MPELWRVMTLVKVHHFVHDHVLGDVRGQQDRLPVDQLRAVVRELRSRRRVTNGSYLAVLNVGAAIERVREGTTPLVQLTAVHAPTGGIPSHARLQGMEVESLIVAEILAEVARAQRLYAVADIAPA